jgi:acyl dehydratase
MPFDSTLVGTVFGPFEDEVDAGWTMTYAAGIGDLSPVYLDSLRTGGLRAHPVFPVCFVWKGMAELDRKLRDSALQGDEAVRRVHASQDMILHGPLRPSARVTTRAMLIAAEQRTPGTYVLTRFETVDTNGGPLSTVYWGQIYRNVELIGDGRRVAEMPISPRPAKWDGHPRGEFTVPVSAGLAHVYTACARQANSVNIHTDTAVARQAGLPAPILMGTATLALSISKIITAEAGGDPERVARIYARFGAMVPMPSEIIVRIMTREKGSAGATVFFETLNADGGRAIRDGVVLLRS